MAGDQEVDFFEKMMSEGVRPLGKAKSRSPRVPTPISPPAPRRPPTVASPAPPPPPDPEIARLRAALATAEARAQAAEAGVLAAGDQLQATEAQVEAGQEQLRIAHAERDGIDARRRDMEERLKQAEAALVEASASTTLEGVLRQRGLARADEDMAALAGLVELRSAELVQAVELGSTDDLVRLLEERIALVCSRDTCRPDGDVVAVRVPPGRCEMCGGSDIRAAFERFAEAADRCGITAIVLVGGSPAYRRQLRALVDRARASLRVDLVSGTTRRPRHKVDADLRRAQLVVIWGATLLDHSVSAAYRGGPARILKVSDRGITRMLDAVRRDVLAVAREASKPD
jgi:hypothetical protein